MEYLYRLLKEYYPNDYEKIIKGLKGERKTTLRINNLKSNKDEVIEELRKNNISYSDVLWYLDALIIEENGFKITDLSFYKEGKIYLQSLSSMIPVLYLDLNSKENILDMASAPGGKTSQMFNINKDIYVTAVEKNKIRYERLKYNLNKLGCNRVNILNTNALKLDEAMKFDKILLDAPCSGSGTLNLNNISKSFSKELVLNSSKIQKELFNKALKLLPIGGTLIYSTCSILKNENEEILEYFLNQGKIEIIPITIDSSIETLPSTIPGVVTVCPNNLFEGFFVAKVMKKNN